MRWARLRVFITLKTIVSHKRKWNFCALAAIGAITFISLILLVLISSGVTVTEIIDEVARFLHLDQDCRYTDSAIDGPPDYDMELITNLRSTDKLQSSVTTTKVLRSPTDPARRRCTDMPSLLKGRVAVNETAISEDEILNENTGVLPGGRYHPSACEGDQKLAIILPYRNRPDQLKIFLRNIHPILQRQKRDYAIFIVEHAGDANFNRGKLLNVGYKEASRMGFTCFVFHDIDLFPENDRIPYECASQPRHLAVAIDKYCYKMPYRSHFGGVIALSGEQFLLTNGFSNAYWGWGAEDDDLADRIRYRGMKLSRLPPKLGRYKMLKHIREAGNPENAERRELLNVGQRRIAVDGLSSLHYAVLQLDLRPLYTRILADIGHSPH